MNLQIQQAAGCGVSGTLREWPLLAETLDIYGKRLPLDTPGLPVQMICEMLVEIEEMESAQNIAEKQLAGKCARVEWLEKELTEIHNWLDTLKEDVPTGIAKKCEQIRKALAGEEK